MPLSASMTPDCPVRFEVEVEVAADAGDTTRETSWSACIIRGPASRHRHCDHNSDEGGDAISDTILLNNTPLNGPICDTPDAEGLISAHVSTFLGDGNRFGIQRGFGSPSIDLFLPVLCR